MARNGSRLKDVKAEKIAKKRKMKRRKRILFLIIEVILLALLISASYMLVKYGKIQGNIFEDKEIEISTGYSGEDYVE